MLFRDLAETCAKQAAMHANLPKAQTKEAEGDYCGHSLLYTENETLKFVQIIGRFYFARVSVVERSLINKC